MDRRFAPARALANIFWAIFLVACQGPEGNQGTAAPPLDVPLSVQAFAADGSVVVTWPPVPGASGYRLTTSPSPNLTSPQTTKTDGVTSPHTVAPLSNGTTYYFAVTALASGRESPRSSVVSATPLPSAPGAPTGVAVTSESGQVRVSWNAVSGATSYKVYVSTSSSIYPDPTKAIPFAASPALITGLQNGIGYYVLVSAVNAGGESQVSRLVAASPRPDMAGAPTGVWVTSGDGSATVTWDAMDRATGYRVYWSTSAELTPANGTLVTNAVSPQRITGLANGTLHYFVVTATNASGESPASAVASTRPQVLLPGVPWFRSVVPGDQSVQLSWDPVDRATRYNLVYGTQPDKSGATRLTGASSPITVTGLTNGILTYFWVSAENAAGESEASQTAATPRLLGPGDVRASLESDGLLVTWQAVAGATGYRVEYWSMGSLYSSESVTAGTTRLLTQTPAGDARYDIKVYALVSTRESEPSAIASVWVPLTPPRLESLWVGDGQATLYFGASQGAVRYHLYVSLTPSIPAGDPPKVSSTSPFWGYTLGGLSNGTTYTVAVTAQDNYGETTRTKTYVVTPQKPLSFRAVTGLGGLPGRFGSWTGAAASKDLNQLAVSTPGYPIFASVDGGATWTARGAARNWRTVASSADGSELVAVDDGNAVFSSEDWGITWRSVLASGGASRYRASLSADGQVWLLSKAWPNGADGLAVSSDRGATWRDCLPDVSALGLRDLVSACLSADGRRLWVAAMDGMLARSSDGGETWWAPPVGSVPWGRWPSWRGIACSADGLKVVATLDSGAWLSLDGGDHWRALPLPGRTKDLMRSEGYFFSADGSRLFAVVEGVPWVSGDDGSSWASLNRPGKFFGAFLRVSTDGSHLFDPGIDLLTSADAGSTWLDRTPGNRYWRGGALSADGRRVVGSSSDGTGVVTGDSGGVWEQSTLDSTGGGVVASSRDAVRLAQTDGTKTIALSTDGGRTWSPSVPDPSSAWSNITSSSDGLRLTAFALDGTVARSDDGGTSWSVHARLLGNGIPRSIAASADGRTLLAGYALSSGGRLLRSDDQGLTWSTLASAGTRDWSVVALSNDGRFQAAGERFGTLFVSEDGGVTWSPEPSTGNQNWKAIAASQDGTSLAAQIDRRVITSTDRGRSWMIQPGPLQDTSLQALRMTPDGTKFLAVPEFRGELWLAQ